MELTTYSPICWRFSLFETLYSGQCTCIKLIANQAPWNNSVGIFVMVMVGVVTNL